MTRNIRFALIGCGRVASRHVEALEAAPDAELVAVCDMIQERAVERSEQGRVPYYLNYHEMIVAHPEIEVVSIITPSGSHFEHAEDVISRYAKHVLIEKPMVMTPQQAVRLKDLADGQGVRIFPIYQNRFNKAVQRVKTAMESSNELGQVRVGTVRLRWCRPQRYYDLSPWRGTYAMDGGALTNQGVHYIDLLRYLCGEVRRVSAITATLGADIEVEDTAVATLEFENGALGVIEIMTSARHEDFEASVSCVCENGLAVISGVATNELHTFSPDQSSASDYSEVFPTVYGFGHDVVMQGVAHALLTGAEAPVGFADGLATIKLLHAIYRSDEVGGWVNLDDVESSDRLGRPDESLLELYRTSPPQDLIERQKAVS